MPRLHCQFIHVPKFRSYYRPFGEFMCVNYMPMGLFSMAELLNRTGHPARIFHLGKDRKTAITLVDCTLRESERAA